MNIPWRCLFVNRLINRRWLKTLFAVSLTLAVWIGHSSFIPGMASAASFAKRIAIQGVQTVQAGVDDYNIGNYSAAIEHWLEALNGYPVDDPVPEKAVIHTNLANAYQQLGQPHKALGALIEAGNIYDQLGMVARMGRIQTEQAQIYASLGQYRRAIALICLPQNVDTQTTNPIDVDEPPSPVTLFQNCVEDGAYPLALSTQDLAGQVAALGSLGDAYQLQGDYGSAVVILTAGLHLAHQGPLSDAYEIPMLNSLANAYGRQALLSYQRAEAAKSLTFVSSAQELKVKGDGQFDNAISYVEEALLLVQQRFELIDEPLTDGRSLIPLLTDELRTQLTLLKLSQRRHPVPDLSLTQQRIGQLLQQLPNSRETAYAAIALAKSYQENLQAFSCFSPGTDSIVRTVLDHAQIIAKDIDDFRAQSFATGQLGHFYECQAQTSLSPTQKLTYQQEALRLTKLAEWQADEGRDAADSQYLWKWQAGRLYESQGDYTQAMASYHQAITILDSIRDDILTATQDLQFDFRDAVEPLYRRMIKLQLELADNTSYQLSVENGNDDVPLNSLEGALQTVDSLRLAELQNYFGDDCLLSPIRQEQVIGLINQNTTSAVISSITVGDQMALILTVPNVAAQLTWVPVNTERLVKTAIDYRQGLERSHDRTYDYHSAAQLYQWIITPFDEVLAETHVKTLVFIQDGILRSIPMAALWDGAQYLIEHYAIATIPSLTLTEPEALRPKELEVLTLGFSDGLCDENGSNCEYAPIWHVEQELQSVRHIFPGSPAPLLNREFTSENLAKALKKNHYSLLHIATHGEFSADPDSTFIVTGDGEKLTFGALEQLIRDNSSNTHPIELIALTACDTGLGSDRSTLGLAGVALRAGARSAIASLWLIDDAITADIMGHFYRNLKEHPNLNKAQALQAAQIAAIQRDGHPGNWAPLILVGNWL
ncbi:CHAT domain-containing protein [Leptothoe sp. LEGE 181152]|nr:CHAT domain-containing protein [Leptothoe sp. LEGE 181152]